MTPEAPSEAPADLAGVRWVTPPDSTTAECFLCGNGVDNTIILSARHGDPPYAFFDVAACGACESAWFPGLDDARLDYPDAAERLDDPAFALMVRHYVELVPGLEWKVSLLERLPYERFDTVLEVGCNAGMFLDYCRVAWNADVVGLEPSAYGLAGARLLGLPIQQRTMAEAVDLHGRSFDLVFAIEVLEHVDDPVGFLRELRELAGPDGVVAITTPRAGALTPQTPPGQLYAALSTGAHRFLTSPEHLCTMIEQAGFRWCHIDPFGMTQLAVMADAPVELGPLFNSDERVHRYYERGLDRETDDVRLALANRLGLYLAGRKLGREGAEIHEEAIEAAASAQFGLGIDRLDDLVAALDRCATFEAMGAVMPFRWPEYLLWRGHRDDVDEVTRTELWETAAVVAGRGLAIDPLNMFVYIDLLTTAVRSLDGRHPARFGKRLRRDLIALPDTGGLSIVEPDPLSVAQTLQRHIVRRLPSGLRRTLAGLRRRRSAGP